MKVPADAYPVAHEYVRERLDDFPQEPWTCDDCDKPLRFGETIILASVNKTTAFWSGKFHPDCYYHGAPWRREMAEAAASMGVSE